MRIRSGIVSLIILGLLSGIWLPGQAQSADHKDYPEKGHTVVGEFLSFYLSRPDHLAVYGYPITQEFFDSAADTRVQYFERARFEYDASAPAGQRVKLSNLGSLILKQALLKPASLVTDTPMCRPFTHENDRHSVCYAFLAYYEAHDGPVLFGKPISDFSWEGDRLVQYFEKARFEWNPDLPSDQWVGLANVGRIQFELSQHDAKWLDPVTMGIAGIAGPNPVISLNARAFVSRPVSKGTSEQTVTVIVRDQNLHAVPQALVAAIVHLSNGVETRYRMKATDDDGMTQLVFPLKDEPVNQIIQVEIVVSYNDFQTSTSAWFRIWW
jgi:hypothetical protein